MKHIKYKPLIALLLAAFILRTYHLGAQPLSGDEAFTIMQWGPTTLGNLLTTIARIDPQPPVALLSYHTWIHLAGRSEFAVRLLSALFSLIAVAGAYTLSRRLLPHPGPFLVMFLCAANPFQLWYAQDARPYAEWIALSLLALIAFIKATPTRRIVPWLTYAILAALSLQVFYLEVFSLASANLYALYRSLQTRRFNPAWPISQLVLIATFVPWLLFSKPQNSTYQPTAGFPNIPAGLTELLITNNLPPALNTAILPGLPVTPLQIVITILASIAIVILIRSSRSPYRYLIVSSTVLPLLLLTALSLITHKAFFRARYIASASIPLLLLLTWATLAIPARTDRRIVSYSFILLLLTGSLASHAEYLFNPQYAKAPPWREIAAILNRGAQPNDLIIQNYPDPAMPYYYPGPAATTILPSGENPPATNTIAQLAHLPGDYRHLWFIRVDTPFWDKDEVVAHWLEANTLYLTDQWIGNMRLYQYAAPLARSNDIQHRLTYDMGVATLVGYTIQYSPSGSNPTDLILELFWQPIRQTPDEYRVFVHLLTTSPDGTLHLWSQDDHPPQQGRLPTTTWPTTRFIFRDVYHIHLQPDITPGEYILATGFYLPPSNRYPLPSSLQQPEPNAVQITTIHLPLPP